MYTEQELKKLLISLRRSPKTIMSQRIRYVQICRRQWIVAGIVQTLLRRSFGKGFTMQDLNRHWRSLFFGLRLCPSKHRRLVNIVR